MIQKLHDFKDQGLVHKIGASTKTIAGGIMALNKLDCVMATYNPDYTDEKPVLDHALTIGKPVFLKKVLASGHANDPKACFEFALSHAAVESVIVGTINPQHLKQNAQIIATL